MTRNLHGNAAQPDSRIRGPAEMNMAPRKHTLIERPSDCRRKYIRIVDRIALRVPVKHVKQGVEVVCRLIDMHNGDGSIAADACPQRFDHHPHGCERVLSLRGSKVGNDDRLIAAVNRNISYGLLQEWQRQTSTARRNSPIAVVETAAFHDTVRCFALIQHSPMIGSKRSPLKDMRQTKIGQKGTSVDGPLRLCIYDRERLSHSPWSVHG